MDATSKKLIVFDLDGTLAKSKTTLEQDMACVLSGLLNIKKIAVISGAAFPQFEKQFLKGFERIENVKWQNLILLPTCGARLYMFNNGWKEMYGKILSVEAKKKIFESFEKAFADANYKHPEEHYGDFLEDRGTQITFSALGQYAPLHLKSVWDPNQEKRLKLQAALVKYISEYEVRIGGTTSIDVTHKGIDKAYGIMQLEKTLNVPRDKILFVGDALFEGGNDYPAKALGVDCIQVDSPEETKKMITEWIT